MSLVLTPLKGIPLIRSGDNLAEVILGSLAVNAIDLAGWRHPRPGPEDREQGRRSNGQPRLGFTEPRGEGHCTQAQKDPRLVELMLGESRKILRVRDGTIIVEHKLGFICANAGIDHSNVAGPGNAEEEQVLLLPRDPDRSAREIRSALEQRSGKRLGVLINDSHGRAWRLGTVGIVCRPERCAATSRRAGMEGPVRLQAESDRRWRRRRACRGGLFDDGASVRGNAHRARSRFSLSPARGHDERNDPPRGARPLPVGRLASQAQAMGFIADIARQLQARLHRSSE